MDPALAPIAEKVHAGVRLDAADGLTLLRTHDIWTLGELADHARRRLHGDVAYHNINRHMNYTNICALSCKFCSFYRKKGDDGTYEYSVEDIAKQAKDAAAAGATEMHIVGGLHPYLPFSYYTDMLRAIREAAPRMHIKAFTAVEIVHLARIDKRPRDLSGVLSDLRDAGLGSLPGGGAEVFDDRVHDEAFKGKIRSDKWLEVHRTAHELGLMSNATILYGHIESLEDRVQHFCMLREAQDEALARKGTKGQRDERTKGRRDEGTKGQKDEGTKGRRDDGTKGQDIEARSHEGAQESDPTPYTLHPTPYSPGHFQTVIPLPFIPDDSELEHLHGPTALDDLRMLAVSRLMLDNFPHVKAFWIMQTLPFSQASLHWGVDDMDGTVVWYDITKVGGGGTHQETGVRELRRAIIEAGFVPVERDTLYRRVRREQAEWTVEETAAV